MLVRPFGARSSSPWRTSGKVTDWYAPAAVMLMLQQFGVAFGALTFVRERQLGIIDIFRVAPVNATETLLGKYLAYLADRRRDRRGADGARRARRWTCRWRRRVGDVAIVMGADPLRIDRPRVRHLAGVGHRRAGGAVHDDPAPGEPVLQRLLPLRRSDGRARTLSAGCCRSRYGMQLLRDVMLRGASPIARSIAGLAAYGLVMFVLALARNPSTSGRGLSTGASQLDHER